MLRRVFSVLSLGAAIAAASACPAGGFTPWDPLVDDNWIEVSNDGTPIVMHTANAGDYDVAFGSAGHGGKARGMNAVKFHYGGARTGHMVSDSLSGTFGIENDGATVASDFIVMVAIDAPSLPTGFSMSLGVSGETPYDFDPVDDFAFYDPAGYDTGRPSGFFSATSPSSSDVSYRFSSGMVTLFAATGIPGEAGSIVEFDYAFENLPGAAVFSGYKWLGSGPIYHTNRGVTDANSPTSPISTFEVVPEPATLLLGLAAGVAALRRRT
jgi:hypothetical protein